MVVEGILKGTQKHNTCLFSEGVLSYIFFVFLFVLSMETLCSLVQNQDFTCFCVYPVSHKV